MFEKLIPIALSAAMTLSLAAYSRNTQTETTIAATTATEQAETNLTGKITAIEGSTVTLSLGSLTEGKPGDMDSQTHWICRAARTARHPRMPPAETTVKRRPRSRRVTAAKHPLRCPAAAIVRYPTETLARRRLITLATAVLRLPVSVRCPADSPTV